MSHVFQNLVFIVDPEVLHILPLQHAEQQADRDVRISTESRTLTA
jgi:hypothetical protein